MNHLDYATFDDHDHVDYGSKASRSPSPSKSCWPWYGKMLQRFVWVVLVLLLALAVPIGVITLPKFSHSCGLIPLMPTDAQATKTLISLQGSFGVGALFPTSLLIIPSATWKETVSTSEDGRKRWLNQTCLALQDIAVATNTDLSVPAFTAAAFSGPMIMNGTCSLGGGVLSTLGGGATKSKSWSSVGGNYSAASVEIAYAINPFSTPGQAWVHRLRAALADHADLAEWYVSGEGPVQMDVADKAFSRIPLMIGLMMLVVLVVIGTSFRSIVAPLRAVVCLMWMLVLTFGLAILTFQNGLLDFLHWEQLGTRDTGSMNWLTPCIAISVVVGLGLDYDIFYTERVVEERERGFSDKVAAVRALTATANTISAAGLIMVVAFLSLMLSSTPTLNEIAFLLIVGVLLDCFITTKVIIPGAIMLLGRVNFWPRHLPPIVLNDDGPTAVSADDE